MARVFTALVIWFGLAVGLWAQSFPDYESTTVNDFAGIIDADTEARVIEKLDALYEETGIEMTVATLSRKDVFAPDLGVEAFARGLFDQWGIGDGDRSDGILLLVLRGDREARLELGEGYEGGWNAEARRIMDSDILPAFRRDDYAGGIEAGVDAVIKQIARPFHAGRDAPTGSGVSGWWAALIFLPVAAMMVWGKIRDRIAARRPCPQCGARGLSIERHVLSAATKSSTGTGEKITSCPSCGYRHVDPYTISRVSSGRSRKSFGGGRSGGGGATGRW